VKRLLEQEQKLGRTLFCSWGIIGWLWFAIGGSHVSDRLSHPRASNHINRVEMSLQEGELFW